MKNLLVDCSYGVERTGDDVCIWLYNHKLDMTASITVTPYSQLASSIPRTNWLWNHILTLRQYLDAQLMAEVLADLDKI